MALLHQLRSRRVALAELRRSDFEQWREERLQLPVVDMLQGVTQILVERTQPVPLVDANEVVGGMSEPLDDWWLPKAQRARPEQALDVMVA